MSETTSGGGPEQATGHQRLLALLWSMAMFVLVVDTSLMNVSIASVVRDLGTVQFIPHDAPTRPLAVQHRRDDLGIAFIINSRVLARRFAC